MTTGEDGLAPWEAERLAAFLGEWSIEGTLTAGETPAAVAGRWRFERAANGWGVRGTLDTEIDGMGTFEENELIGFDSALGTIHLFSMNKYTIRDHSGRWSDDNTLLVGYAGTQEGKQVSEEISIEFVAPDRMVGHVIERVDGAVAITTELTMTRQG